MAIMATKTLNFCQSPVIIDLATQHGAHNIRIFGSVARDDAKESSDIDFLVDMEHGRSLFDLGGLNLPTESRHEKRMIAPDERIQTTGEKICLQVNIVKSLKKRQFD